MCGLAGFLTAKRRFVDEVAVVSAMADRIRHRGPDDSGAWVDVEAGFAVAHRRLSIVDLSAEGRQPMRSSSGRYVLAYNGEVYNHLEIRRELEHSIGYRRWRGHSDTETLLAAFDVWGIDATLQRSVGMFAFALWDRQERSLVLARDRAGEKPMYYGWQGGYFLFGSELKALRAHPAFQASVDRGALSLLLRHNYVPTPYSIYEGVFKLPPGTTLRVTAGKSDAQPTTYWSLGSVAERGVADPFLGTDDEAIVELSRLMNRAVARQKIADVPLGALLSGGIDSSLIASMMQAQSAEPIRTFTIGFSEGAYDEAAHAREIARHLGTAHTDLRLSGNDALELIPTLPLIYDEPFADSSQIPTHLVMKLARRHVTVALSGDAGDEFFGGYNRYFLGPKAWRQVGWLSPTLRRSLGRVMAAVPASTVNQLAGPISRLLGVAQLGEKLHKFSGRLRDVNSLDDLYLALVSEWPNAQQVVVGGFLPDNLLDARERWPALEDPVARMMALDGLTYLPDDILTKVDRASMAVSLEARAPFLDRDVIEFSWRLPMRMKLRDGKGKWILRRLLDRYVPRALIDRPKMGFSIPLDEWLRGPLRSWASDLLAEDRLRGDGYLNSAEVAQTWRRHLGGHCGLGHRLWSVLMFQAWLHANSERD